MYNIRKANENLAMYIVYIIRFYCLNNEYFLFIRVVLNFWSIANFTSPYPPVFWSNRDDIYPDIFM